MNFHKVAGRDKKTTFFSKQVIESSLVYFKVKV
jgi:hypothetical protein